MAHSQPSMTDVRERLLERCAVRVGRRCRRTRQLTGQFRRWNWTHSRLHYPHSKLRVFFLMPNAVRVLASADILPLPGGRPYVKGFRLIGARLHQEDLGSPGRKRKVALRHVLPCDRAPDTYAVLQSASMSRRYSVRMAWWASMRSASLVKRRCSSTFRAFHTGSSDGQAFRSA